MLGPVQGRTGLIFPGNSVAFLRSPLDKTPLLSAHKIHPEDGNCNVRRNTGTHFIHDSAYPKKIEVTQQ